MAFPTTGVSVSVGFVGVRGRGGAQQALYRISGSGEMPVSGTPTTLVAPDEGVFGEALFHVLAFQDAWVVTGPTPVPGVGVGFPVKSGQEYDFAVLKGEKLAWVAA